MAFLIVETGSNVTGANSYLTLTEADEYHEKHLYATDWTGASDDTREAALMWATRLIDEQVNWYGGKTYQGQPLRWPRIGIYDPDGYSIGSYEIPQFLKDAVAEYARVLIGEDLTTVNDDIRGISEMKVDVIQIKFDKRDRKRMLPASVWSIVRQYGSRAGSRKKYLVRA